MKNLHLKKNKSRKLTYALVIVFILILLIASFYFVLKQISMYFDTHTLTFNQVVKVELKEPITIKERKAATREIVKIIESIPAPSDLKTDPEKLIYKYFGIEHYKMAIAVSLCEGLNHPADGFNTNTNGSIDIGYMRINSVHFKTQGCSLLEVATPEGNISCGYRIWDRADGIEGNKEGSFSPWVGFTNGCALTKYE